jgi:cell division septation protein DedD
LGYNVSLRAGAGIALEDRLKERLTGASLLVVLVVVLVPAMFRGEHPGTAGTIAATTGGATASQVYTIDLKGAAPAAPEPTAAVAQPAALPADAPATAGESPSTAPSPSIARAPVIREPPPAAETRPPMPAAAPAPVRPAPPRPADVAPPPAARSAPATGGFVVQVGSFTKRENASLMVKQAARKGVRLTVAGPDDRGIFRVRSTVVRTRQEAVALQEKLQAQGYKGLVGAVN